MLIDDDATAIAEFESFVQSPDCPRHLRERYKQHNRRKRKRDHVLGTAQDVATSSHKRCRDRSHSVIGVGEAAQATSDGNPDDGAGETGADDMACGSFLVYDEISG